jgi:AcrR family transcriptional regulator
MEIAARMMNRDGAASVTPAAVAKVTGLTRNALYYYYRDKESLLLSCYLAAAEHQFAVAEAARSDSGAPEDRLARLVNDLLAPDVALAILHDLDLLPESDAAVVRDLQSRTVAAVASIFEDGASDQSFRPVPAATAAHVLLGMADWARLWQTWVTLGEEAGAAEPGPPGDVREAILRSLLHGFTDTRLELQRPPEVSELLAERIDVLDREAVGEQKRLALLGIASRLFNLRGIDATSIDDIARAADATKGLIYSHFRNKAALVDACYDRAFDLYERFADAAESAGGIGALESLAWPMHLCAQALLSRTPPLMLQAGVTALPQRHRRRAMALAARFRGDMTVAIENGLASSASMDFIELSAGSFFWIPRWHEEAEQIGPYELGDRIVDLLVHGVLKR